MNAHNAQGESPLDVAIRYGHKKVADILTETAIERRKIQN